MSADESSVSGIDLAAEADFRLGNLTVSPSTCRVLCADTETRVEPRVMEVLIALWRSAGRTVTRDHLVELCWGGRAISDDAIARVIAKVRQLAPNGGDPHFLIETLSKVGFRLVVPDHDQPETAGINGPAPAAIQDASPESPISPPTTNTEKRRLFLGAGLVVAAVVVMGMAFVFWPFVNDAPVAAARMDRVVLLPFETLRAEPALQRLARNTHEAVTRQLTLLGIAPVRSGADVPFEMSGTVDREGDTHSVKISIVDHRSRTVVWARRFDRRASKEAGFDEQIAADATVPLSCIRDLNVAALDASKLSLLLKVCGSEPDDIGYGLAATKQLVEAAPELAIAHALRAWSLADHGGETEQFDGGRAVEAEVRAAADRALALDPKSAVAHLALGRRSGPAPRLAERERHLRRALALNPDFHAARFSYVRLLREVGRLNAAGDLVEFVQPEDRRARQAVPHLAFFYAMRGDRERAQRIVESIEQVRPEYGPMVRWTIAVWWEDSRRLDPALWRPGNGATSDTQLRCWPEYISRLNRATQTPLRGLPDLCAGLGVDWRIRMLSRQGDVDGAHTLFAADPPDHRRWTMFLFYPEMKAFRRDQRFMEVADRLGLLTYWRETKNWPDFCKTESPPYPCR